ncbi:porin family protein [Longibacter salinarum]|nr:porin family protein [Longibacter salinarum]
MKKFIGLTLIVLVASVAPAFAQFWSGVGVRAGASGALLRGDNVGITDNSTDRNYGFTVSLYKAVPLGSGFALQPEVMYSQKGGALSFEESIGGAAMTDVDVAFNVDYVELPVAVSYTIPMQSRYVPMLYAGPYVGFATRREANFDMGGLDVSIDGDDAFKRWDYGAVFGADLGFQMARRMATLGVRYDLGIADIVKDGVADDENDGFTVAPDVRNDEWSIVVGMRL